MPSPIHRVTAENGFYHEYDLNIIGSSPISVGKLDGKPLRGNVNRFPLPAPAPIPINP